jgi:hypothetical protein
MCVARAFRPCLTSKRQKGVMTYKSLQPNIILASYLRYTTFNINYRHVPIFKLQEKIGKRTAPFCRSML